MRVYTIHERPRPDGTDRDPVLVKEGFSWPAFLFSVLWALWHRLWLIAAMIFLVGAAIEFALAFAGANGAFGTAAELAWALLVGFGANDWRRATLDRAGWTLAGVVAAPGRDAALRRWFDLGPRQAAAGPAA